MELSIVIVNWNSAAFVRECLTSIRRHTPPFPYEVIVIDNASGDDCGRMLREEFSDVHFLQRKTNDGFAKANNEASQIARGRFVLFLNPDTELHSNALARLVQAAERLPTPGVVGCRLLNSDCTVQDSCVQAFPTLLNQLLDCDWLRKRAPRASLWGVAALEPRAAPVVAVDAISGACMLLNRELFEEVGRFSECYFMYSEDVDLCYKTARLGRKNYLLTDVTILHHGGGSTTGDGAGVFSSVMMAESRRTYFRAHRSSGCAAAYQAGMGCVSILRLALILFLEGCDALRGGKCRWKNARRKWLARLRWSLGMESWVRSFRGQ